MTYSCLIVDDELTARQGLVSLCDENSQLEVIGTCKNGVEAIDRIRTYKPDLILLDVQMPKIDGFEVLTSIPKPWPQVIFITAYDEYAIKAFEINAVDYILKPFSDERFQMAIKRAIEKISSQKKSDFSGFITKQAGNVSSRDLRDSDEERLIIKSDGNIQLLLKKEIMYVEAFDYYVKIHVEDRFYLIRESMKMMESKLETSHFLRVHKSFIVNREYVQTFARQSNGEYQITLTNDFEVKVSRTKVKEVKEWLV